MGQLRVRRFILSLLAAALAGLLSAQSSWALSAEDGVIAYQPSQDGQTWVMNPDGTDQHSLIGNVIGAVAWSPDGSRVAFVRAVDGLPAIWIAKADGSDQHLVIRSDQHGVIRSGEYHPAWTPDGRLVYTVETSQVPSVLVADSNGSHVRTLVEAGDSPVVLPNGEMIVTAEVSTSPVEVWHQAILDRTGRHLRLLDVPIGHDHQPVTVFGVAPDGRRLAIADTYNSDEQSVWEEGTLTKRTVTVDPASARYTYDDGGLTWSPAGDAILTDAVTSSDPDDVYHVLAAQLLLLGTDNHSVIGLIGPANTGQPFRESWQPRCTLTVSQPNIDMYATPGRDRICVTASHVTIRGGGGNDLIWVYGSHDRILGGRGRDVIAVHGPGNVIRAGRGADLINTRDGRSRANTVYGGRGNDYCISGTADTIHC